MRVVVIGGTGHIGTYLVPCLVEAGHEVICVSRGMRSPYHIRDEWNDVRNVSLDRASEERTASFGRQIRELKPDVVVDLICFTPDSARHLVDALKGEVGHFLHCGTIWVYGHSRVVPTTEEQIRRPLAEYGIDKAAVEAYLLKESKNQDFPATILHPGHIVGPGWPPLNPAAHFNPEVFVRLSRGEEVKLPNLGQETVHHVHAGDVAGAFMQAVEHRENAVGESFNVVTEKALSLRGYAESMAEWFGQESLLSFLPWEDWRGNVSEEDAAMTWDHIRHSPNCSIAKARSRLGFQPRYTSLQAVQESVTWLVEHDGLLSKIGS